MDITNNPYFQKAARDFVDTYARKKQIENNFSSAMLDEYTKLTEEVAILAVKLLRFGIDYEIIDETIQILVENTVYNLPCSDIQKTMGTDEYNFLISKAKEREAAEKENKEESIEDNIIENSQDEEPESQNMFNNASLDSNPFMAMMSAMAGVFQSQNRAYDSEKDKLVQSLYDRISSLEREKSNLKDNIISLKEEKMELQMAQVSRAHSGAPGNFGAASAPLEQVNSELHKLKSDYNHVCYEKEKFEKENENLKQQITSMKRKAADNEKYFEKAVNEAVNSKTQELESAMSKLQKTHEDTLEQLNSKRGESNKRYGELQKKYDTLQSEKNALQKECDELNKEKESLEQERDELMSKVEENGGEDITLKERISELEETVKKLEKEKENISSSAQNAQKEHDTLMQEVDNYKSLAYRDSKSSVKNANAFNEDFKNIEKDTSALILFSINGMKSINLKLGRQKGDTLISSAGSYLRDSFGDSVYRFMGDQFFVIVEDATDRGALTSKVQRCYSEMKRNGAETTYAVAFGADFAQLTDMITNVETAVLSAKRQKGQKSQNQRQKTARPATQAQPMPQQQYQPYPNAQQAPQVSMPNAMGQNVVQNTASAPVQQTPVEPRVKVPASMVEKPAAPIQKGGAQQMSDDEILMNYMNGGQ